jgi:hypothetical protein
MRRSPYLINNGKHPENTRMNIFVPALKHVRVSSTPASVLDECKPCFCCFDRVHGPGGGSKYWLTLLYWGFVTLTQEKTKKSLMRRAWLQSWSPRKNIGHVTSSRGTKDILNSWLIKYLICTVLMGCPRDGGALNTSNFLRERVWMRHDRRPKKEGFKTRMRTVTLGSMPHLRVRKAKIGRGRKRSTMKDRTTSLPGWATLYARSDDQTENPQGQRGT